MNPDLVWFGTAAFVIFLELVGIIGRKPGDTITEQTRMWWRTDTKLGRIAFGVAWPAFAAWFLWHILWQGRKPKA